MTPEATGVPTTPLNAEADLALSVLRIREVWLWQLYIELQTAAQGAKSKDR